MTSADVPLRLAYPAGYGGGGNRTRVVLPQLWLSRAKLAIALEVRDVMREYRRGKPVTFGGNRTWVRTGVRNGVARNDSAVSCLTPDPKGLSR